MEQFQHGFSNVATIKGILYRFTIYKKTARSLDEKKQIRNIGHGHF